MALNGQGELHAYQLQHDAHTQEVRDVQTKIQRTNVTLQAAQALAHQAVRSTPNVQTTF